MAGTVAQRELGKLPGAPGVQFALATEADDPAIRRLLRENPMNGAIELTFEREPNYFRGAEIGGATDQTIVAYCNEKLVCVGRCLQRDCWVNGRLARIAYLSELRLDAATRGRFAIVRDGYQFFRAATACQEIDLHFTAIAADNMRARRFLERGVRGMPIYSFLAELLTLLIKVPRRGGRAAFDFEHATEEDIPQIVAILNEQARQHHFSTAWTSSALLDLSRHALPINSFLLARGVSGDVIACGALWDQRSFRQTIIRKYSRFLSTLRPVVNLAAKYFDTASLPPPGSVLAHAFLSPLAFAPGAEQLLPDLIAVFFSEARRRGIEFLTVAFPEHDPQLPRLRRRFSTRSWRSRLYRVHWPGQGPFVFAGSGSFLPDISLL